MLHARLPHLSLQVCRPVLCHAVLRLAGHALLHQPLVLQLLLLPLRCCELQV
jgi:hypothetical protein